MTGDRKRTKQDWQRVGRLLRERRAQLGFRVRRVFAESVNLPDKTIQEIEKTYRETFSDELLAAIEKAYLLAPRSIEQALDDPTLQEFPHRITGTVHEITLSTSVGTAPSVGLMDSTSMAEKLPPPPDLPEHLVGAWHRFSLAEKWLWWTPGTTDLKRAALAQVLKTMQDAEDRIAGASHPDAGDGRAHRAV